MTWTILLFTALMAAWAIGGAATADNAAQCANDTVLGADTCTQARNAGTGIAVVLIFVLWFVGFIVLSLIWFMSRPKGRLCPACGENAKRGRTTCRGCGHDFAVAAARAQDLPAG
jgi:hypothetical protein